MTDCLTALADLAWQLGATEIAADAAAVSARVEEKLFYVACVGQFKRGKSTLLNALIGAPLLPTGILPVTALITIVRYHERSHSVVRFADGERREVALAEIVDYVSEERNPRNRKQAAVVEVFTPAPLLGGGMCLVDTPGLGSIFRENSETTRRFLPQVDAALLMIGADPPLSAEEAALAEEIRGETAHMIVVLNKADRLTEGQVQQAAAFARAQLESRIGSIHEIFIVSAVETCTRDWCKLEKTLTSLAHDSGSSLVEAARRRAIRRTTSLLEREVDARRSALLAPLHETEMKLAETQRIVAKAQRSLEDLSFLFASEQEKFARSLAALRDHFLQASVEAPDNERNARRIAEERIKRWIREIEPQAKQMYASVAERFERILRSVGSPDKIDRHLQARQRFFFTALSELTGGSLFRRRDFESYFRRLLESNSARVMNDFIDRIVESRRRLEKEIAVSLRAALTAAERSGDHARTAHQAGAEYVAKELAGLDAIESELAQLVANPERSAV